MSNQSVSKHSEVENRPWNANMYDTDDDNLALDGRIMDGMLSEHMCERMAGRISSHRTSWILCFLQKAFIPC